MSTSALVQTAGVLTLIGVLVLALLVLLLRLIALPLAGTALALDSASHTVSRYLPAMPVSSQHPNGGAR